ncbi:MAG: FHA domain-containing protein [Planctomycetes bacterium]|nr:FHA domain-containing protein [Planctomycetota bacterium]
MMKVSLVVAQGVHAGKIIPIATASFLIGRDPHCNLRPASPAISKQHCGIFTNGAKVVARDYGSTNGTFINGEQVSGERELANDDKLKVGPLEFVVKVEAAVPRPTVKAVVKTVVAPATVVEPVEAPANQSSASIFSDDNEDSDAAAAMMLAMEDSGGDTPTTEAVIPDGNTVMDIPATGPATNKPAGKPVVSDTAKAAADILSKYMRRPRT